MVAVRIGGLLSLVAVLVGGSLHAQQDTADAPATRTAPLLTGDRSVTELGSAVTVLDVDSLLRVFPVRTLTELLTGRVPGVQVLASSGTIGAGSRILIRGPSSFTTTGAPQIYVDGVRVDDDAATLRVPTGGQTTSRVDDINVEDIATIVILPGPAGTALYGTDAANGVLLITTKRGVAGGVRVRAFSSQGMMAQPLDFPASYRAVDSSGARCTAAGVASGACRLLASNLLASPASSPFRNGYLRQYGLSASGGGASTRYYLAGTWDGSGGVYGLPGAEQARLAASGGLRPEVLNPNYLRRANLRGSGQWSAGERADVTLSAGYFSGELWMPLSSPDGDRLLSSGLLGNGDTTVNGGWVDRPGDIFQFGTSQHAERLSASLTGRWSPSSVVSLRAVVGLDRASQDDEQVQRPGEGPGGSPDLSRAYAGRLRSHRYTATVTGTFAFHLGSQVAARTTAGIQYFKHTDYVFDSAGIVFRGLIEDSESWFRFRARTTGVFLTQQVSWSDRFFLTGSLRRDATNRLGVSDPAAVYPHVGIAWRLPIAPSSLLGSLRWRAAYGIAGREARVVGFKPERTRELEAGVDAELWQGRLTFRATAYTRRTSNIVSVIALPPSAGGLPGFPDSGAVSNKGLELTLSGAVVRRPDVTWDISVSAWGNRNRVLKDAGVPFVVASNGPGVIQLAQAGLPLGTYWGFPMLGYSDANGDGIVSPAEVRVGSTPGFIATPFPTQGATLSTALTVRRRVQVAALLEYRGGNGLLNSTELLRCLTGICRAANDPGSPLADQAAAAAIFAGSSAGLVGDASFVKVREISLAFNAPTRWAARVGASEMSLILAVRNLATWSSYRGLDPEVNVYGPEGLRVEDSFTQPLARYWTARLDLSF